MAANGAITCAWWAGCARDIPLDQARQELDTIASTKLAEFPRPAWARLDDGFIASTLQDDLTRTVRPALFAVLGAVILLLTIACVNVTNLLLARGVERHAELAVRAALGRVPAAADPPVAHRDAAACCVRRRARDRFWPIWPWTLWSP